MDNRFDNFNEDENREVFETSKIENEDIIEDSEQNNYYNNSYDDDYIRENRKKSSKEILESYIDSTIEREYSKRLKRMKKNSFAKMMLAVILCSGLSSASTVWYLNRNNTSKSISTQNPTNAVTINTTESTTVEKAVAQKAMQSVVGITTVGVSDDMFSRQSEVNGLGSGVIVSKDGYIITNNHVVDPTKTKQTTVLLNDGSKHNAEILWSDKALDLAVIKINAEGLDLQPVEIADSSAVSIGDKAIAIGSPLGVNLQSTLTSGYISGKDRVITLSDGSIMEGLLQTDAAINPGNSGGALLNERGQLVGINTAKAGNSDGIGFSIPINVAKPILEQIISTGKFESVVLGVKGIDVARYNVVSEKKLPAEEGVYVHEVLQGSPAQQAGIQSGDIILMVGDKKVTSNSNLKTALLDFKSGDSMTVEVLRNGEKKQIKVSFTKIN